MNMVVRSYLQLHLIENENLDDTEMKIWQCKFSEFALFTELDQVDIRNYHAVMMMLSRMAGHHFLTVKINKAEDDQSLISSGQATVSIIEDHAEPNARGEFSRSEIKPKKSKFSMKPVGNVTRNISRSL
jgi:hypothetical protein